MKKIILGVSLVFVMALSGAAMASAGNQEESLVSLSYLTGTYRTSLSTLIQEEVKKAAKPIYDAAVAKVNQRFGGKTDDGAGNRWSKSESFLSQNGQLGNVVTLNTGSGLFWLSGSGRVSGGLLVDTSTGSEVTRGQTMTAGHRYLAAEQAVVTVTTQTARWMAEGEWLTTSDSISRLPFTDVPVDSWYYDAVCYVVEQNLFNGTSATQFSPLMSMERRMMTTVLHRMAGSPAVTYTTMFSDVPAGQWYTDGTIWAGQTGVVSGPGDGTFLPALNVARQQIAVILYHYAQYAGYDVSASGNLASFSDGASVAVWAQDAMSWAVSVDILHGDKGMVMPEQSATRVEVATMLQRFQNWIETQ